MTTCTARGEVEEEMASSNVIERSEQVRCDPHPEIIAQQ